jgi:hypothetical protein
MERNAALGELGLIIAALIILIIGRFLLFPAVCQLVPIQLPGMGVDFCVLFR